MTARQFFVEIKNLKTHRPQRIAELFHDLQNNELEDRVLRRLTSLTLNISRHSDALDRQIVDAWIDSKQ